jgi:hypothetical protein
MALTPWGLAPAIAQSPKMPELRSAAFALDQVPATEFPLEFPLIDEERGFLPQ